MKRDLSFIVSILCNAAEYEAKGAPTVFVPEQMSDKQRAADMVYWGEMLVNSGFLRPGRHTIRYPTVGFISHHMERILFD